MIPVTAVMGAVETYTTERAVANVRAQNPQQPNSQRQNAQDNRSPQQRMADHRKQFVEPAKEALRTRRTAILRSEAYKGSIIKPNIRESLLATGDYSIFVEENGRYVERKIGFHARGLGEYYDEYGNFRQEAFDGDVAVIQKLLAEVGNGSYDSIISSANLPKKVRLEPVTRWMGADSAGKTGVVEFDIAPDMSEERQVNYLAISEIRQPGSLHIYMGTNGRTFTINAKLVTTNDEQAVANYDRITALKAMTMPEKNYVGILGDDGPPVPVRLYGYGLRLHGIPCVVTSLSIPYPEDVDYYYYTGNDKKTFGIPIVNTISITLQEIRSMDELEQFNIEQFKKGDLPGW